MYLAFVMKCSFYRHKRELDGMLMRDYYIRRSINVELIVDYTSLRRYGMGESKLAVETFMGREESNVCWSGSLACLGTRFWA
jgi:hypothetical protein